VLRAISGLPVNDRERAQIRQVIVSLLDRHTDDMSWRLIIAEAVAGLDPTATERAQIRTALLDMLARTTSTGKARKAAGKLLDLKPTADELGQSSNWVIRLNIKLFAAARQNSPTSAWLAALPGLSRQATHHRKTHWAR